MTYEQAYQWAIDNVPMYEFDTFEEWEEEIFVDTRMETLEDSSTFHRMLETAWENEFGSIEEQQEGVFP